MPRDRVSLNSESLEEGANGITLHEIQLQNIEANSEATVTLRRSTLTLLSLATAVTVLALLGGLIVTAYKLTEMSNLLNPGLTKAHKEFPSLSRKEGIVPEEVWRWIVAVKADMTFNGQSANSLLRVSSTGRSLYQASPSSPPRLPTAETYLTCICVSSKVALNTRSYFEVEVTQIISWTLGLRTQSFDADNNYDSDPAGGIWTIGSADGKIVINDGEAIPTPYATPSRLGLYLDYKRGQLSFYDAATRLHLHTYLATFREKLLFYAAVQVGIEQIQHALMSF
ncbi:tripartite motif-containing protein 72-like [Electrophorus electricus]|uniref:tripartite motif-containing protein 72-like n=1 Tax=Electrophorus electricus TaxID=8005 RepID=UPI0015CFB4B3|nr:tripartite motif-containing protein 72-like [Electrophorus electricus]